MKRRELEWMNEQTNKFVNATNVERKNQSMNKWMNEWVGEWEQIHSSPCYCKFSLLGATSSLSCCIAKLPLLFLNYSSYFSGSRHLAAIFVSTLLAKCSLTTSVIHVFTSCSHDGEFSNIFATQSFKSGPTMQWDGVLGQNRALATVWWFFLPRFFRPRFAHFQSFHPQIHRLPDSKSPTFQMFHWLLPSTFQPECCVTNILGKL